MKHIINRCQYVKISGKILITVSSKKGAEPQLQPCALDERGGGYYC